MLSSSPFSQAKSLPIFFLEYFRWLINLFKPFPQMKTWLDLMHCLSILEDEARKHVKSMSLALLTALIQLSCQPTLKCGYLRKFFIKTCSLPWNILGSRFTALANSGT